jgi:AbiU2
MIPITGSVEFAKLLRALADDVVSAHIYWRLHCDLVEAVKKQPIVWAQSRTFWYLTITAHELTAIGHLCKAFDQEEKSLHLRSWLNTIRENTHLFETHEFKLRLASNPHVDSLLQDDRVPDRAILDSDILECSATDPLVRKLMAHRGAVVAHRGAKRTLKGRPTVGTQVLSVPDIEALLTRARSLLNRYSHLFAAEIHSVSMIGRDDYEYIFTAVAAAVARARRGRDG